MIRLLFVYLEFQVFYPSHRPWGFKHEVELFYQSYNICSLTGDYKQWGRVTLEIRENDSNSFIIDEI